MEEKPIYYVRNHPMYPERLKVLADSPERLYVLGNLPEPGKKSVAIVGARACSAYGRKQARYFAVSLAARGIQVISGLAAGIDAAAHEGALEGGGKTFAVLGCGTDICYPRENYGLYRRIREQGGLLSEYEPGVAPHAWHFPRRNRIISGLADLILVVEAKQRSGALITADCGLEQGKIVCAVPGRLGDALSAGCNQLIAQGAGIALSPELLLEELGIYGAPEWQKEEKVCRSYPENFRKVWRCLSTDGKSLEELSVDTGLCISEVARILMALVMDGIAEEDGAGYCRLQETGGFGAKG